MTETSHYSVTEHANICIHCGLCCDGSLFRRAKVDKHDDLAFLKQMGVEFVENQGVGFFLLPCMGLQGTLCTLYHDQRRFRTCKSFQCKLLKQYLADEISYDVALHTIREVLKRRQSIKELSAALPSPPDSRIMSLILELKHSGKLDDLYFRRTHAKQLLDCVVLGNLISQRFHKADSTATESCKSEDLSRS